jgi:hypothetical protein
VGPEVGAGASPLHRAALARHSPPQPHPHPHPHPHSYDDGPSPNSIPILDALKKTNSKATFCVIGSRVADNPEILKRMYDEGHTICAHTWSHHYLTTQSNSQLVAEFQWTIQAIEHVIGVRPLYARPPYGDIDDRVRYVFQQMSLVPLLWNRDCYDWKSQDTASGYRYTWIEGNFTQWIAEHRATPGSRGIMSLQHDLYAQTSKAAVSTIAMVANANFKLVNAAQCTGVNPYTKTGVKISRGTRLTPPSSLASGALAALVLCIWLFH